MILSLSTDDLQRELRLFATACIRRVWHLLPPGCRKAVEASERFAEEKLDESELAAAVASASEEAQAIWPGYQAPDARAYAASAAVDASSVWPRTAANLLAASSCAASAVGCEAAEADEARYDEVYETARIAELAVQTDLLRSLVNFPTERKGKRKR